MKLSEKDQQRLKRVLELMRQDLAEYETKYDGKFAENPHAGLGNRKTRCVNEATLPIITCHPVCITRCATTCYVINTMTYLRKSCRRCQARNTVLRRIDPEAYYEYFFKEAERRNLPIRLSDGGDFENAEQVKACIAAARRHPSVHAIGYTKRIELLHEFIGAPENLHMRYSSWEGDEINTSKARDLGFLITEVVYDGSGNCPYQICLAQYNQFKKEQAKIYRTQGFDKKTSCKMAGKDADAKIYIHHCRTCAEKGCGCCAKGIDIRFNVVK